MIPRFTALFLAFFLASVLQAQPVIVSSPDGRVQLSVTLPDGRPHYAVSFDGKPAILPSALGLVLDGAPRLDSHFTLGPIARTSRDTSWKPLYGERSLVPNRYNAAGMHFHESIPPKRKLAIMFRVYNEGVAFRYSLSPQPSLSRATIASESTEFRLAPAAFAWETERAQTPYRRTAVAGLQQPSERPLLLELPNGLWAAIAEAAVDNYPSMFLSTIRAEPHSLAARLHGPARIAAPFSTPWRVILLGSTPGTLLEHNYLLLNLSPPSSLTETAWIKPGKILREITLSTKGGLEAVDFAARHGIQYIEYDAGWYGHEYEEQSDATRVNIDPRRLRKEPEYQGLDLPRVIAYAKRKNIGVWLYVNRRALERQIDTLLPLFARWGVAGVKYGFVNVHSQDWTRWLYSAIAKAATHRLLLDIHDEFRPTGLSRTWPHLLTQEGIRGNEEMPDAHHSTVLPFTRMLAGAADYTYCWFDQRLKNTWAHQLAMTVVVYSPLQFLYWYDRPSQFTGTTPGMDFLARVPTTWDDTRVLSGAPGQHAVIARRKAGTWYLAAITNNDGRTLSIPLTVLKPNTTYEATLYTDGDGPRDVRKATRRLNNTQTLDLNLQPRGGAVIELRPVP
ncbi:MAG: glycoside hydrolase family 97 catalytic domain-containing protein [Bryobacterales bacterium]|nr:glycoside hydrolase family 97 catalytic domain-containing protein [Bryobacterales bacterium]